MEYLQKLRKTIGHMDNGFGDLYNEGPIDALAFFIITLFLGCAITSTALIVQGAFELLSIPLFLFIYVIGWGVVMPISTHVLLVLLGWGKPASETFKAYFYGATPMVLFGWLPCMGTIFTLVSAGNVIRYLHGNGTGGYWKPLCAVILPGILLFVLFVYVLFWISTV